MANKRRTVAIIGLGVFGSVLSRELTRMGDRVIGLDRDEKRVSDLADEIDSVMQVDASDLKALKEVGLEACDSVVVAIGEDMQASLLAAMNVQEIGCEGLWVKTQSPAHRKVLEALGVGNIVQPEQEFGLRIAQVIHNPRVSDYLALGNGKYVAEIEVPREMVGATTDRLKLAECQLKCVGVFRSGELLQSGLDAAELVSGDRLLIFGRRSDLRRFADGY